jgi:hypothetical protein
MVKSKDWEREWDIKAGQRAVSPDFLDLLGVHRLK